MQLVRTITIVLLAAVSTLSQTVKLSGTVYDANGAVIAGAAVTAVGSNMKLLTTVTNDSGEYELELKYKPYDSTSVYRIGAYEISAIATHFERTTVKDFKLVPAFGGRMRLDFALDLVGPDPCHDPTACIPGTPVKSEEKPTINTNITPRRTEELVKNKDKNKKKDNH